jgi:hypothetical protein
MFRSAREVLDHVGPPPDLPAARPADASWPPELDPELIGRLLDEDARHEARYLAERRARLEPLAAHLGLRPDYVLARDRERLREDAAVIRLVRWLLAAGKVDGWQKAYQVWVLRGHFGWKPAAVFNWYRERSR